MARAMDSSDALVNVGRCAALMAPDLCREEFIKAVLECTSLDQRVVSVHKWAQKHEHMRWLFITVIQDSLQWLILDIFGGGERAGRHNN